MPHREVFLTYDMMDAIEDWSEDQQEAFAKALWLGDEAKVRDLVAHEKEGRRGRGTLPKHFLEEALAWMAHHRSLPIPAPEDGATLVENIHWRRGDLEQANRLYDNRVYTFRLYLLTYGCCAMTQADVVTDHLVEKRRGQPVVVVPCTQTEVLTAVVAGQLDAPFLARYRDQFIAFQARQLRQDPTRGWELFTGTTLGSVAADAVDQWWAMRPSPAAS